MHHIKSIKMITVLMLVNLLSACGGGGGSDPVAPGDTTPPSIVSGLQGNNPISPTATLIYVFSETLDTNSLDLTGTTIVTGGVTGYLFSTTTVNNDTITFTSSSDWVAGDLTIDVADLAGNKFSDKSGNPFTSTFTIDSVAPVGTPNWATDSAINTTTSITITYDEKISNTAVTISGNMAAQAATATVEPARITIAPASTWTVSDNQTLTVAVTDLAGNIGTLSLTYHVLDGGVHVSSTSGVDSNTGSAGSPKATIQAAIDTAQTVFTTGEVRVAAGTYDETLTMVDGISLLGGYTADFLTRDPAVNVSTITDTSSSGPIAPITATFITIADTLLDGFTINGSSTKQYAIYSWGNYTDIGLTISNNIITGGSTTSITAGIMLQGGATINGNTINGGSGTSTSYGIYIPYSNGSFRPVVNAFDNIITGGGVASQISYGFYSTRIDGNLHNNVIHGGAATSNTFGVTITNSSGLNVYSNHIDGGTGGSFSTGLHLFMYYSLVYNNTIYGGSPGTGTARAIFLVSSSTAINQAKIFNNTVDAGSSTVANGNHGIFFSGPEAENEIINNNFIGRDAATTHCLYDNASAVSLIKAQNNNFFNCAIYTGTVAYATIAELEATSLFTASGNVSVDPVTVSATDYHLTPGSPASVINNGLDLSSFFTTDKDGVTRGFSMGAYVYVP